MKGALAMLLVASLAACDIVYSLDRPVIDAPPVPGPDLVTARFVRKQIAREGGDVMELTADDVSASVVLANGARPEVEREGDTFRFAWTRGMTYFLTFVQPDRAPLTYVMDTESLVHIRRELARDGIVPSAGTQLDITMTNLGQMTSYTFVMATGIWVQATSAVVGANRFVVDWADPVTFVTRQPRLLAPGDRLYCVEFDTVLNGSGGLAYHALKRWAVGDQFAMIDGTTTMVTCPLADMSLSKCARAVVDRDAELELVQNAVSSPAYSTITWGTHVVAIPAPELGPYNALWLAFDQGNGPFPDFIGDMPYQNPFAGHDVALQSSMGLSREVRAKGQDNPITFAAARRHYYRPADNCGPSTAIAELAMPSPPAFGGAYFVNDGDLQLSATQPIRVSWELRSPGPVDYYLIQLYEIVAGDGEDTKAVERHAWVTTKNELTLERDRFETGHQYIMGITATYGFPDAATGDFSTTRWPAPVGSATNYSGVFTVAP
ncbi:MAG: hypothetical protein AB7T06_27170 [Kofleriaceae bacterium]